jgi:formylglycine-generating enzyme required for sulfatase activity
MNRLTLLFAAALVALAGCTGGTYTAPVDQSLLDPLRALNLETGAVLPTPMGTPPTATRMVFQRIPGGVRTVATADALGESGEVSATQVDVSAGDVWLCTHEVSQAQWRRLAQLVPALATPWTRVTPASAAGTSPARDDLPAWGVDAGTAGSVFVSWNAAHPAAVLRLPTTTEWESAARSAGSGRFGWGDEATAAAASPYATVRETTSASAPSAIGSRRPLGGWYDLHGNVWEWVTDSGTPAFHLRGGSWSDNVTSAGSSNRRACRSDVPYALAGVRPVLVIP